MKIVAYYRVSTQRQGRSGLGLEAQREAVAAYAATEGPIVAEFTEIESGRNSDRPQLAAAIRRARGLGAKLVIARLDRLARDVLFVATMMKSGVEFVCCDMPAANEMTLHIVAAVAEAEAKRISTNTKAALAAAKRRGALLGTRRPGHHIDHMKGARRGLGKAREAELARRRQRFADCYESVVPIIKQMDDDGESLSAIAEHLNQEDHRTTTGKLFKAETVKRILQVLSSTSAVIFSAALPS